MLQKRININPYEVEQVICIVPLTLLYSFTAHTVCGQVHSVTFQQQKVQNRKDFLFQITGKFNSWTFICAWQKYMLSFLWTHTLSLLYVSASYYTQENRQSCLFSSNALINMMSKLSYQLFDRKSLVYHLVPKAEACRHNTWSVKKSMKKLHLCNASVSKFMKPRIFAQGTVNILL